MNATLSKLHMDSSRNFRLTNKSINLIIILKLFEKKIWKHSFLAYRFALERRKKMKLIKIIIFICSHSFSSLMRVRIHLFYCKKGST